MEGIVHLFVRVMARVPSNELLLGTVPFFVYSLPLTLTGLSGYGVSFVL
jgi:hypothetical protein